MKDGQKVHVTLKLCISAGSNDDWVMYAGDQYDAPAHVEAYGNKAPAQFAEAFIRDWESLTHIDYDSADGQALASIRQGQREWRQ